MVPGGEGMVDFKGMLSYFKSAGFAGPVELYQEYHVDVPGVAEPVNMLGTDYGAWKLEMPKSQYVALLKRDVTFYTNALTESGLLEPREGHDRTRSEPSITCMIDRTSIP